MLCIDSEGKDLHFLVRIQPHRYSYKYEQKKKLLIKRKNEINRNYKYKVDIIIPKCMNGMVEEINDAWRINDKK